MNVIETADRLEPLGILAGAALVLVGIATVASAPWATNGSVVVSLVQLVGVAATIALGIGLARLSYVEES